MLSNFSTAIDIAGSGRAMVYFARCGSYLQRRGIMAYLKPE
jgi:hypothetical protein